MASDRAYLTLSDGTTWPSPGLPAGDLEWQLRYGDPASVRLVAASVVAAYAELIGTTQRRRDGIVRELRALAAEEQAPPGAVDLMAALRASVERAKARREPKPAEVHCARCGAVGVPVPHGPDGMRVCDPCLAAVEAGVDHG